jgi:prohibitin 2
MFSKLTGLSQIQLKEGFHFKIPYFQTPIVYNIQTRPITIKGVTANKDM